MSYAIRKDGLGWRAVESKSDCADDEIYSENQPSLIMLPLIDTLEPLTRRQFKLALLNYNLIDKIETAINSISDVTIRAKMQIEYAESTTFIRKSDALLTMGAALNLTDDQINEMWLYALTL